MCRFCEILAIGDDSPYDPQLGRGGVVPGANMPPDLILTGTTILTMDDSGSVADTIAIRQGVIQAVGRAGQVLPRRGRGTRVVPLTGRALTPGFVATAARLPARRDRASLDRWIEGCARAGFTSVDLAGLGDDATRATLGALVSRRHRLRLRAAADPARQAGPGPEPGNDLMRIEALRLTPAANAETLARALAIHAGGWGILFDCSDESEFSAALGLAALAAGRRLAGTRLIAPRPPTPGESAALDAAGIALVTPSPDHPAAALHGPAERVLPTLDTVTRQAARLAGLGTIAGQLRPGLYADFTLLSHSPLLPGLPAPAVIGTWLEGVPVRPEVSHAAA